MGKFSHLDAAGNPTMVDVGEKAVTQRVAKARSTIVMDDAIIEQLQNDEIHTKKGPVFQTAILAGVMAVKKTSDLIPLCHPLAINKCSVDIKVDENKEIVIDCMVKVSGKTGVEMEALTGASIAALTIYDMCKGFSHNIIIKETKLIEKTSLIKPLGGDYHRNEWAIIGAPCDVIHKLAAEINEQIGKVFKIGYLDAAHKAPKKENDYHSSYTDKIDHQSFTTSVKPEQKQSRKFFTDLDVLLVNGNHFIGDKQIVIISEEKRESLSKKLDRLTDIKMILLKRSDDDIHKFLMPLIEGKDDLQIFRLDRVEKIANAIVKEMVDATPPLNGLVLAGGKSQRMGKDKGALEYYNKPHREYLADILNKSVNQVFISCRKNQDELIESRYKKVYDTFEGLGPYGAILSAFREQPNHAWFTIACDLPHLDKKTIKHLVASRNPSKLATCFHNPETKFPEPLITIWEPRAYPVLLEFLSQGYSCPRKVLINTDIEEIEMSDPIHMLNANDPTTYEQAKKAISESLVSS